ncbi:MAG: DUF1080 domain-containing protein [bacterium]|nr:DUF1080 domain-containing protein [bacterium]
MKRILFMGLLLSVAVGTAFAADIDTQGIYKGSFSSGARKGQDLTVQMVAQDKGKFRAVFPFDAETPRVYVGGRIDKEGKGEFTGTVDLKDKGGKVEVTAVLDANAKTFEGKFDGKGRASQFKVTKIDAKSPTFDKKPPEGAVVLLDGSNLDSWIAMPEKWAMVEEGAMQVSSPNLRTKQEFGSATYHLEFRTPFMPGDGIGSQGRGNSGMYVQGRYEIQVLDSFGAEPQWNLCGGIYKVAVPLTDAVFPPGVWQTYDIEFQAAQFDAAGKKVKDAVITVVHNGVTVHDNLVLPNVTAGGISDQEAPTGPIMLQHHGNPVRYRNTWVLPKK